MCLHGIKFSSMKGGDTPKRIHQWVCGGLFGIFITPVNVISFPPLIYTTANLTENLKIIILFNFFSWKCNTHFGTQEIQNEENKTVKNENSIIFEKSKRRLVLFVISVWSNSKKDQGKPRKFYFLKNSKSSDGRR